MSFDEQSMPQPSEEEKRRQEAYALERMKEDGVAPTEEIYIDTWGYHDVLKFYFPNQQHIPERNRLYLEVQKMTEGVRQMYQKATNAKVTILKASSNAEMGVDPARDRYQLIKKSVVGWNMVRKDPKLGTWDPITWSNSAFDRWFDGADPGVIEKLERFIRSINPWMLDDLSEEGIIEEQERLAKLLEEVQRRKFEKESFSESGEPVAAW